MYLTFPAGSTFLLPTPPNYKIFHLFILIAVEKNTGRGLIVNVTTHRAGRDESCILIPGDHPFVKHKSVINYEYSRIIFISDLKQYLLVDQLKLSDPVNPELLKRIQQRGMESKVIENKCRNFLASYMNEEVISDDFKN
ncbi:MAG: hypothetical protein ACM3SY_16455 [Candidatus Omnitrophota bacterium]